MLMTIVVSAGAGTNLDFAKKNEKNDLVSVEGN